MSTANSRLLTFEEFPILQDFLPENPENVVTHHHLRRGTCDALVHQTDYEFDAIVIQSQDNPEKLYAHGSNTESIFKLTNMINGWERIEVTQDNAQPLYETLKGEVNREIWMKEKIKFAHPVAVECVEYPKMKELTALDRLCLETCADELRFSGYINSTGLLSSAFSCLGYVGDKIVSFGYMSAYCRNFAEIRVSTRPEYRNNGYGSAGVSFIASKISNTGRIPVISILADDTPAIRIANKLNFKEYSKSVEIQIS